MVVANAIRFLGTGVREEQLSTIRALVADYQGLSRKELAATVCELLGWTRGNGQPKERECREWLERLEAEGLLSLPAKRSGRPTGSKTSIPAPRETDGNDEIRGSLGEVGPIRLELVTEAVGRSRFRELVGHHHYLGYRTPYGAQLRYLVQGGGGEALGCLLFSSAAWRMAPRDQWIGWDDVTRGRRLVHVVCNSRFLILPWVKVKNLASTILSKALSVLPSDWERAYGVEPYLLETLVDESRFTGTCYRAANWIALGTTTGRGRMDLRHERVGAACKRIFVYPLRTDSRQRLCEG